ncbi:MAG: cation:proton antiporter [Anaerolineales bacterium]|nr:cation:proton antiporter [Anaerolineales bacterium]
MEESRSFIPLLLVVFLAFLVPIALSRFKKLRLPIVVGEILAGIIIGRSGLGWVQAHDPALDLLSEFGFVFLMFLSGMEIDFSSLGFGKKQKPGRVPQPWGPLSLAGLSFGLTLVTSLTIGWILFRLELVRDMWMMGLILSTTSLGIVVPVLKERRMCSGRFGQSLLVAALIADFATMLLITVEVAVLSHGLTLDILLVGVLFLAFFFMYRFGNIFFNQISGVRRMLSELSHATAQIKVRAAFTMMLIFVVLSEILGTEIILGAFLAGAIVSLLRRPEDEDLTHQLDTIGYGFFIPIFFIMVGVNFNVAALLGSPQALVLLPILFLAALVVKFLPALVFRLAFSWRETFAAGALLSARLSLIIAASAIGLRLGVISEAVNANIILVAIITVTLAPVLFLRIMPGIEQMPPMWNVVAGASMLGLQVAEQLRGHQERVVLIDPDESRVRRARKSGFEALRARIDQEDGRAEPYLSYAKTLISVHGDVEMAYRVCKRARTTFGIDPVVVRLREPAQIGRFEDLGVSAMSPAIDQAILLTMLARNPAIYDLLTRTDDDKDVCEVTVYNPAYLDKPLRHLELPGDMLILAIRREGELVVPHGGTVLYPGDELTILGSSDCVETSREIFP